MILSFAKPKRAKSVDEWKSYSADGAPPGVYVPNMDREDRLKWKAKVVGHRSENFQIEIRSTEPRSSTVVVVNGKMPNVPQDAVLVVRLYNAAHQIKISANGPMYYSLRVWKNFQNAVAEAHKVLALLDNAETRKETVKQIRAGTHPLET